MVVSEIPQMTYQQYRTARRLVHECCNYDCGNCLLLDNGEECVCPQSITYSLICKWFRAAVLWTSLRMFHSLMTSTKFFRLCVPVGYR